MQTLQLQYLLKRPKILTTTTTTSFVYWYLNEVATPLPCRVHGHALLQKLSLRPDFMKLWTHMVPERDRRPIEKFLKTENKPCPR